MQEIKGNHLNNSRHLIHLRLKLYQDREKCVESNSNPELEQLRVFLDEKDKHISDLMNTLKNFHVRITIFFRLSLMVTLP